MKITLEKSKINKFCLDCPMKCKQYDFVVIKKCAKTIALAEGRALEVKK